MPVVVNIDCGERIVFWKSTEAVNDGAQRKRIADGLAKVLADTYTLYLKTHNFHWNVTGPMFQTLHVLFMQQYTELWNALDPIAERIRSLGYPAPGSYKKFVELAAKELNAPPAAYTAMGADAYFLLLDAIKGAVNDRLRHGLLAGLENGVDELRHDHVAVLGVGQDFAAVG